METQKPKFSGRASLADGSFLNLAVWPGKKHPEDEVISVEIRKKNAMNLYDRIVKIAVYRTRGGDYTLLS